MDVIAKAFTVVEEMMDDRGYFPISNGVVEVDVVKRMTNRKYLTPNGKYVIVTIADSTSSIKQYSNYIENPAYESVFFLYTNSVTIAHTAIEKNLDHKIEIHPVASLQINITRHEIQPYVEKHTQTKIKGKLPKISFYDPICRYYKFNHRDVIKVTSKVDGSIHYRQVV
jgi:DNA-directed RNA polymerase subunit H (RpoH/RPB5)